MVIKSFLFPSSATEGYRGIALLVSRPAREGGLYSGVAKAIASIPPNVRRGEHTMTIVRIHGQDAGTIGAISPDSFPGTMETRTRCHGETQNPEPAGILKELCYSMIPINLPCRYNCREYTSKPILEKLEVISANLQLGSGTPSRDTPWIRPCRLHGAILGAEGPAYPHPTPRSNCRLSFGANHLARSGQLPFLG